MRTFPKVNLLLTLLFALILSNSHFLLAKTANQASSLNEAIASRYVLFINGTNTKANTSVPLDDYFGNIEGQLASIGVKRKVYFSYSAARFMSDGGAFCRGWGNQACSSNNSGDLSSLYWSPVYEESDTKLSLKSQMEALDWLLGQIIKKDPTARIDIVGYSLGGIITSYWASQKGSTSAHSRHIHSIVLIDSPVGGITIASQAINGCELGSGVAFCLALSSFMKLKFGEVVLRSLQLPASNQSSYPTESIIPLLPKANDYFTITAIQSSTDYMVNGLSLSFLTNNLSLPIGKGIQAWVPPPSKYYIDQDLGGEGFANQPIINPIDFNKYIGTNHVVPLKDDRTAKWVAEAVQKPVNTTSSPITPSLLSPQNGASVESPVVMSWGNGASSTVSNLTEYLVEISIFSGPVVKTLGWSRSEVRVWSADLNPGSYKWRMKSRNFESSVFGESLWSDYRSFTVTTHRPCQYRARGDAICNNAVDISDMSVLAAEWDSPSSRADFNSNGEVDLFDLAILRNNWQQAFSNAVFDTIPQNNGDVISITSKPVNVSFAQTWFDVLPGQYVELDIILEGEAQGYIGTKLALTYSDKVLEFVATPSDYASNTCRQNSPNQKYWFQFERLQSNNPYLGSLRVTKDVNFEPESPSATKICVGTVRFNVLPTASIPSTAFVLLDDNSDNWDIANSSNPFTAQISGATQATINIDQSIPGPIFPKDVVADSQSSTSITIRWRDTSPAREGFRIYSIDYTRQPQVILVAALDPDKTEFTINNLPCEQTFSYAIAAFTSRGQTLLSSLIEAKTQTCDSPKPIVNSTEPTNTPTGTSDFFLIINGEGFTELSSVQWDGIPRETIFISSEQLSIVIYTSDLVNPGPFPVNVFTPGPGGGVSNSVVFNVQSNHLNKVYLPMLLR